MPDMFLAAGIEFTTSTVVSDSMTVYARWSAKMPDISDIPVDLSFSGKLKWINDNAVDGSGVYHYTYTR
jgi:hypothetical protein